MTSEEHHAWLRNIEAKLDKVKDDVSHFRAHGCVQAHRHDDHEDRVRKLEASENQRIGMVMAISAITTVVGIAVKSLIWK